jgi:methylase of polypeptide subunit release factors
MQGPLGFPLSIPDASQAESLRGVFENSGFSEEGVAARLGIPGMLHFKPLRFRRETVGDLESPLDALIRLFLDEEAVAPDRLCALLGAEIVELMETLGLALARDGHWISPVAVYPARGLWFASDLAVRASEGDPPPDLVYAVRDQTLAFLNTLPEIPCRRLLDLGSGTGVAALVAARYAEHAWALDITERAAHFARFNQALNGVENVTVTCGDLYAPVAGLRFDRIVSHPPYVPVPRATSIFRDGGEDGEQVLRRIVEGLPMFLEPGGRFYGFTMASDREDEPLEDRVRKWLGDKSGEFNLLLVARSVRRPDELKSPRGDDEARHWHEVFEKLKVQYMITGSLVIERHASPANAFTARVLAGPRSGWRETEWLRTWMNTASRSGNQEVLLALRPRMTSGLELRSVHRVREGRLSPEECTLAVEYPFRTECVCRPWVAAMVGSCDGARTGREILELCRAQGTAPPETTPESFAQMLASFVCGGILEVPEFPLTGG